MACKYFHKSNSIVASTSALTVTFADNPAGITDGERFCFVICQTIPAGASVLPVKLTVNGKTVPLWNKYGNSVIGSGISSRAIYKGYYGAGTADHIIAYNTPREGTPCGCVCNR